MEAASRADLRRGCQRARILVLAIAGASVVLVVLGEFLRVTSPPFRGMPDFPHVDTLRYALAGVTLGEVFLLRVFDRQSLRLRGNAAAPLPFGQFSAITQQLIVTQVAKAAICFSMSVYGMLLFLIAVRPADLYGYVAVSLLLQGIHFPRIERWEERARHLKG